MIPPPPPAASIKRLNCEFGGTLPSVPRCSDGESLPSTRDCVPFFVGTHFQLCPCRVNGV